MDAADVYEYLEEPVVNCFASMKLSSLGKTREKMKKRLSDLEYYFTIALDNGGKVIGESNPFIDFMNAAYPQLIPKISFSIPMWLLGKRCTRDMWRSPQRKTTCPSIFPARSL